MKLKFGRIPDENPTWGDGLQFAHCCIYEKQIVDIREQNIDIPPQWNLTKDFVSVQVDSVVYYKVVKPELTFTKVFNVRKAIQYLATAQLRASIGQQNFLSLFGSKGEDLDNADDENAITTTDDKDAPPPAAADAKDNPKDYIGQGIVDMIRPYALKWGVEVLRMKIKSMTLPPQMQRAMAIQAESERIKDALVINAKGEARAAKELKDAAMDLKDDRSGYELRYLQTMNNISVQNNESFIFPIPTNMFPKAFKNE